MAQLSVDGGGQVRVGGCELVEPRLGVGALAPDDVCGEILDVDLESRSVGPEEVKGQTVLLDDQHGLVTIAGQIYLGRALFRLVLLRHNHEPPWGFALFYASRTLPPTRVEVRAVRATDPELAFDLAVPAGKTLGLGESRPHLIDMGVEALFDAHNAESIR